VAMTLELAKDILRRVKTGELRLEFGNAEHVEAVRVLENAPLPCDDCDGSGKVECLDCDGSGEVNCGECKGTGVAASEGDA
jgi:hypothetical protein